MLIKGANAVGMIASGIKIADDVVDTAKTVKKISDAVQDVELASKSADKISDAGKSAAKVAEDLKGIKKTGNFAGKLNAKNIPNMTKDEILDALPKDWKITENNGFVHVKDTNGNIRMRIDPPDKVTSYDHVHLFDEKGNSIGQNLNILDRKSPDAYIPYKK